MEHGIGRATESHDYGDGVLESPLGHDLAGSDALAQEVHHGMATGERHVGSSVVDGSGRCRAGKRHPDGFTHRGHGVGGEHTGTTADRRASSPLDGQQLVVVDITHSVGANRLEDADHVQLAAVVVLARHD